MIKRARELARALGEKTTATGEGGLLIIQTVNYDRILKHRPPELPEIRDDRQGIVFRRFYEYALPLAYEDASQPGLVTFRALLRVPDEGGGVREYSNSVPLRPITKSQLTEWLKAAGFKDPEFFGGFDRSPHTEASQATVVVARKI
ncbi:MAG: hypothetical protein M1598_05715 [Actinobacteria bacterium]|nr:hypothetical protein [Actinomycetota bacterium]